MRVFVAMIYLSFILSIALLLSAVYYYCTFIFDLEPNRIHYPHPEQEMSTHIPVVLLAISIIPFLLSTLTNIEVINRLMIVSVTVLLHLAASLLF
jgi:hypothetical protein